MIAMTEYLEKQQRLAKFIGNALITAGLSTSDFCILENGNHPDQIAVSVMVKSDAI